VRRCSTARQAVSIHILSYTFFLPSVSFYSIWLLSVYFFDFLFLCIPSLFIFSSSFLCSSIFYLSSCLFLYLFFAPFSLQSFFLLSLNYFILLFSFGYVVVRISFWSPFHCCLYFISSQVCHMDGIRQLMHCKQLKISANNFKYQWRHISRKFTRIVLVIENTWSQDVNTWLKI
jgi:hypothetical protein